MAAPPLGRQSVEYESPVLLTCCKSMKLPCNTCLGLK